MAVITRKMLDPAVIDSLSSLIKQKMFSMYGGIPIDKGKVVEGLNQDFVSKAEEEIKVYYDGLYDDDEVKVDISVEDYAELL